MRRSLVNDPDDLVVEALEGLALAHPTLVRHDAEHGFVARATPARDKVGLVSGGGSGHEPLHAGFVGHGMLDVAVPGAVFASPTALQLYDATRAADAGRGVLHIVKNYTGDVINFTVARELADEDDDIATEVVLVDDDLATDLGEEPDDPDAPGRRGTAAVVAVEKICGAAAEEGADLGSLAELGRSVAARARSMAFAIEAGTHPGSSRPAFDLDADEVELGVGIHGERGRSRVPFGPTDELVARLVDPLVEALRPARGSGVIAIVNGLGSTYPLELYAAARAVHGGMTARGVRVDRFLVGSLVTSLDMHGVSVTLLPVDDELLRLWDAPVRTPALTW
ncbi:dihydroxyacetone kinase [Nocardioides sp. Root1257]|uniref:dihydroxyacetone kinase subunit DhaK n=1 Tax=unclassified Nocardioides TaxID=2615069 RepID=UPI0006FD1DCE|nr:MULTISPECIES: dihydroxyacetone kinase subunit DhaK [unclassified Nocardioides]KQW47442.1 dihydroxyacetone kinase [Nocardioides sp. Root1257]KRC45598.1 dihydroxyacetone kinase [Nocardioides sp. Root224]